MTRRAGSATLILLLVLGYAMRGGAQDGKQQRIADLAYRAEMAHEGNDCTDSTTLEDRNECLNDVRVETYKNYTQFFSALREALIEDSPNDANALALDGTDVVFEKYRATACDAMVKVYDLGTIKHPGSTQPNARTRCLIQLTRGRMRDLKELYAATL
ncbi:MAG TPA: lysozyme inhibitor LprI family protein [Acidobacteriaceae bacterium]